jgi:hypothetical protein
MILQAEPQATNRRPHDDDLPTARTGIPRRHQAGADLQALVESGRGDMSLSAGHHQITESALLQ